jgi:Ser-tRNA(Ala) deacylase AlaX
MTGALYLKDSYLKECEAIVKAVKEERYVVLDKTIFYPKGGGQPCDTGKLITVSGLEFRVLEATKKDGEILHEIEPQEQDARLTTQDTRLKTGDRVKCVLDWERRYKLMRMHTAAHVFAGTLNSQLNALITGNQLDVDKTRFDFDLENFDRETFNEFVKKTNGLLQQDIELRIYYLPREEAMNIPGVVKLAAALPPSISELRIVDIPGIDIQADGGTHVKNLKEVGQIELLKLENKGKNNRRIYFTLTELSTTTG